MSVYRSHRRRYVGIFDTFDRESRFLKCRWRVMALAAAIISEGLIVVADVMSGETRVLLASARTACETPSSRTTTASINHGKTYRSEWCGQHSKEHMADPLRTTISPSPSHPLPPSPPVRDVRARPFRDHPQDRLQTEVGNQPPSEGVRPVRPSLRFVSFPHDLIP